jgi:hypothetical protein
MTELHWSEVDGVAVVWAEGRGPLSAGLLFRTGLADEVLATSGQTHLLEHLALSTVPDAYERQNGYVGGVVTGFVTRGSPAEVSAFLQSISCALATLPGDRLDAEKQVVEAEVAARPYDFIGTLLTWRYGAVGHGLTGVTPVGYRNVTLDQLHMLARQRFTRGNAVLWLSGPPPNDLRLVLPHGQKLMVPPLVPVLPDLPSWYVDDACGGVAVSATVPRVTATSLFAAVASRRLRERLRTKRAVSYAPTVGYEPLDADIAHLVLFADSDVERRAELTTALMRVFDTLDDIGDAEVDAARREILDHWTGSLAPPIDERAVHEVQLAAMEWIFGREYESIDVRAGELTSVGAAEVAELGATVQQTALFALPGEAMVRSTMGARAPASTMPPVEGRVVKSVDAPIQPHRLVVGTEGVTLRGPDGSHCTVRYAELAAALAYEDGALQLIGTDGAAVAVEPRLWRDGTSVCRDIRGCVPPHLLFEQGARPDAEIPKGVTSVWRRLLARLSSSRGMLALFLGAAVVVGVIALTRTPLLGVLAAIAYRMVVWPRFME